MTPEMRNTIEGQWISGLRSGSASVQAAAAPDGLTIFLERCSVCHGKEADGAQGPALRGLLGHKIGVDANYGYTHAIRAST